MKQLHDFHYRSIEKEIESFYQRYADKEKIDLTEDRKRTSEIDVSAYQELYQTSRTVYIRICAPVNARAY